MLVFPKSKDHGAVLQPSKQYVHIMFSRCCIYIRVRGKTTGARFMSPIAVLLCSIGIEVHPSVSCHLVLTTEDDDDDDTTTRSERRVKQMLEKNSHSHPRNSQKKGDKSNKTEKSLAEMSCAWLVCLCTGANCSLSLSFSL